MMSEQIDFTFRGRLSNEHTLDFYEAGRFQYGAARLMVKLDQFRRTGRFSARVTYENNTRILLRTQEDGSFIVSTLVPFLQAGGAEFLQAHLGLLWSYVADRVLKPASTDNIRDALATQWQLLETFDATVAQQGEQARRTLDLLHNRIDRGDELTAQNTQLYERLLSEGTRRAYLEGERETLRAISPEQDAKLISMASPLLKDMGVALRSSASTLQIVANDNIQQRKLVYLDKRMAAEVDTSRIDDQPTLILVRIVQYNTETGWGKLRTLEAVGLLSFNVPADRKEGVRRSLLDAMDEGENTMNTYIQCLFVRSLEGILKRAIIFDIVDLDEIDGGL
jgi:hypothetical protein